jgi:homoserine acetyltransferase
MARRVLVLASTAAMPVQNIAFQELGRQAIMADPNWQGGAYYGTGAAPMRGWPWRAYGRAYHLSVRSHAVGEIRAAVAGP